MRAGRSWRRSMHQGGVTLLELMATVSLAAVIGLLALTLYRQGHASWVHLMKRGSEQNRDFTMSQTLARLVLRGAGLREVGESGFSLVTGDGRLLRLGRAFGDSVLRINDRVRVDSICDFRVDASGALLNPDPLGEPVPDDSLDSDRNGLIDFSELDRDHDRKLDTLELPHLRLLVLQWRACGDTLSPHTLVLAPRNRVGPPATLLSAWGDENDALR